MLSVPRAAFVAALFLCCAAPAAALAAPAPSPSPSATPLQSIGQTIETADRHSEPITNTTRPTYIVTSQQIDARGDRTVADALVGVPGLDIYRYGAFGTQANIFIHGTTSSSQVLVLLDGIPVAPGSSGQIDLGSFSSAGVRRVEVVEGGGSTLYGSSAIGGVINIITGVPRGVYLETSGGSYGDQNVKIAVGVGKLGVSVERHIAQNDYGYPAETNTTSFGSYGAGSRDNAWAQQTDGRLTYHTDLTRTLSASVEAGSNEIGIGVPGDLNFGGTPDARQAISQNDIRLDLTQSTAQSTTSLNLSGSRQLLAFYEPSAGPENDTDDGRTQVSLRHVIEGGASTFTSGIDISRESALITNACNGYDANPPYECVQYVDTATAQAQSAIYAQEQYAFGGGAHAVVGLRGEHDAPIASVLLPTAGLTIPFGDGFKLALNGSGAFHVPTIVDLYYPGYSNPNLKPERSSDGDITLGYDRFLGGVALTLYGREANNLIQYDPEIGAPENIARASVRGLQATLHSRPFHGTTATLSVTNTYRALDLSASEQRLTFAPVFTSSLTLDHSLGKGPVGFGAVATIFGSHIEGDPFGGPNDTVAGWTTVDAYVRVRLAHEALLSLRARNLGDERYEATLGYPAPGRTFSLELATR